MNIERLRQQSAPVSRQFTKTNDSPQTKDLHGFFITLEKMDPRLANLIDEYIRAVAVCVDLLVDAGATRPTKDYEWPPENFPHTGTLGDGRTYWCHGVGCAVKSTKGRTVDFDFGENGETNGFSISRLKTFLGSNPQKFQFASHDEMSDCFDDAKSEFVFSGYILYYLAA